MKKKGANGAEKNGVEVQGNLGVVDCMYVLVYRNIGYTGMDWLPQSVTDQATTE